MNSDAIRAQRGFNYVSLRVSILRRTGKHNCPVNNRKMGISPGWGLRRCQTMKKCTEYTLGKTIMSSGYDEISDFDEYAKIPYRVFRVDNDEEVL